MSGEHGPDPADLRISHADREKVAEVLREAAGEGRLDLDELDERLEATWAAKTYRDLVPITLDLPGAHAPLPARRPGAAPVDPTRSPPGTPATHEHSLAVMGEVRRTGVWDVGATHTATAFMGSVVVDLRQARFGQDEVVVHANAVMGSVEVVVDAATVVRIEGVGLMGSFEEGRARVPAETGPSSPVVRVRGVALMGSVEVRRKGPPRGLLRRGEDRG